MLVTFYTNAYENLIFFGDIAKTLIQFMGHSNTIPGAIRAEEIPHALSLLQQNIKKISQVSTKTTLEEEDAPISLAHRAAPLIQMLNAAAKKNCDVLWK
jgi:hypothetical protein